MPMGSLLSWGLGQLGEAPAAQGSEHPCVWGRVVPRESRHGDTVARVVFTGEFLGKQLDPRPVIDVEDEEWCSTTGGAAAPVAAESSSDIPVLSSLGESPWGESVAAIGRRDGAAAAVADETPATACRTGCPPPPCRTGPGKDRELAACFAPLAPVLPMLSWRFPADVGVTKDRRLGGGGDLLLMRLGERIGILGVSNGGEDPP